MKRSLILFLMLSSFLSTTKAQLVSTLDENRLNIRHPNLELRIDDRQDLENSQGYLRAQIEGFSGYASRNGLLNHNEGLQGEHIFLNFQRAYLKTTNRLPGLISNVVNKGHSQDFGFNVPLHDFLDLRAMFERSASKDTVDVKMIHTRGDTLEENIDGTYFPTTHFAGFSTKYFSFKYLHNEIDAMDIHKKEWEETADTTITDETFEEKIFSATFPKYFNYTNDGNHHSYIALGRDDINAFLELHEEDVKSGTLIDHLQKGKLIIATGDHTRNEVRAYEREIEDGARASNRIYDDGYEKDFRFLRDLFYSTGPKIEWDLGFLGDAALTSSFRWEMQQGKRSIAEGKLQGNFKYLDIYLSGDNNENYNVAFGHKEIIVGRKKINLGGFVIGRNQEQVYIGYKRNGRQKK